MLLVNIFCEFKSASDIEEDSTYVVFGEVRAIPFTLPSLIEDSNLTVGAFKGYFLITVINSS